MPTRSARRAARRTDSSNELDHLDSAVPARSRRASAVASDGSSGHAGFAAHSREHWDLEKGDAGGRKRDMRSLGSGRTSPGAGEQAPEPLVRPSKKAPNSQSQGRYAPVAQGDPSGAQRGSPAAPYDSDPEGSPGLSGGEMQHSPSLSDSEDEKKPASTRSSRSRKGGPSAAEDQPANRMSKKRWLLLGGLGALILVIIIAVVAIYMNSSKSDSSSAGSDAAEDSEPSSHSKSQAVSGSSGLLGASSALSASITGLATSAAGETGATTSAAATVSTQAASSPASTLASAASSGIAAPGAASLADGQPSASSPNLPPGAPTSAAGLLTTAVGSAATGSPAPAAPSVVPPSPSAVGGAVPINSASSEGTGHTRPVPRPAASAQASGGASAGWTGPTQTASSTDAVVKASSTATWFSADQHLSACKMTFADADLIAAISPVMFGSDGSTVSQLCGAELVVWQPDSDQTIMVKIGDVCNECPGATAIDLSQSAFLALAPGGSDDAAAALDAGVLTVQWWFADSAVQQSLPFGFETWAAEGAEASR